MSTLSNEPQPAALPVHPRSVEAKNAERLRIENERAAQRAAQEALNKEVVAASVSEVVAPSGRTITRDNRKGFGSFSQKLARPNRVGYHRHWFNDTPGRIQRALEAGWTHVMNDVMKKNECEIVGVAAAGGVLHAYLLEIPEDWYNDDMLEQEKMNSSREELIKGGAQARDAQDKNAFYPSAQGRSMQLTRR